MELKDKLRVAICMSQSMSRKGNCFICKDKKL